MEQFSELLSTRVTRRQFLLHLGLLVLALTGVSGLIRVISQPRFNSPLSTSSLPQPSSQNKRTGFGVGPYGM